MVMLKRMMAALRNWRHGAVRDAQLSEELTSYRELLAQEKMRAGMDEQTARRLALLESGGGDAVAEAVRDVRAGALLQDVMRDARYAVRTLLRSPAFAVAAVLALALGFGASGAVFSVVEVVLLRPLPYAQPDEIVVMLHEGTDPVSPANFLDWQRAAGSFSDMAAAEAWSANVEAADRTERVRGIRVTPAMFELLGVAPALGVLPADGTDMRSLVLSHDLWRTRFGGDAGIIGRSVRLDGDAYVVAAVMPRAFRFAPFWVRDAEMWAPLDLAPRAASRNGSSLRVFGRLAPGVSMETARAEMSSITAALETEYPGTNRNVHVTPLREQVTGDVRPVVLVLLGAVLLVLLIACANVAHLLLARATARSREMAVRTALGAGRRRLIRQLLIESLVLSACGLLLGLALAAAGARMLALFGPRDLPGLSDASLNAQVAAFMALLALLTALSFGLAPLLGRSTIDPAIALRDRGQGSTGARHGRLRQIILASELALALVLLVSAGLLLRSFVALSSVDPGLATGDAVTMQLSVRGTAHVEPEARAAYYRDVLERVRARTETVEAGLVNHVPLAGDVWGTSYRPVEMPEPADGEWPNAVYRVASEGYFEGAGIEIVAGRGITRQDAAGAQYVVVVNDRLARAHWSEGDAVGRTVLLGEDENGVPIARTIVGVVRAPVQGEWSGEREPEVYIPLPQDAMFSRGTGPASTTMTLVARTNADPEAFLRTLVDDVRTIDRAVAISDARTMRDVVHTATAAPRFNVLLTGAFAIVALLLGAIGIYGLIGYTVAGRTAEIAVRMALGARPAQILTMILRENGAVVAAGTAVGLIGALLATRLMQGMLFGIAATDAVTYAVAVVALVATAFAASIVPAWRASRGDAATALRA